MSATIPASFQANPAAPQAAASPSQANGAGRAARPNEMQVAQLGPGQGNADQIIAAFGSKKCYEAWCTLNGLKPLELVNPAGPANGVKVGGK